MTLFLLSSWCFASVISSFKQNQFSNDFGLTVNGLGIAQGWEPPTDYIIGLLGLLLVLEGTRRAIGLTLCVLSLVFLAYAAFGQSMPDWLFPHRGYSWERIVSQTFLHSQGVFGIALKVMFTYVFLFVLFGALLEKTGATGYIINSARRLFRSSVGGPAKVAVVSSGAMGSLSGSAVANTATTGTFTIPMMRSSGFRPTVAGGIEAAASSGGALVPPIMGAGAYMMLEIVEPAVTYLQIIKAALIPAILYYTALLLIVHFHAKRIGAAAEVPQENATETYQSKSGIEGLVFLVAFITLILFLLLGYTPFRAVSLSLLFILILVGIREIGNIITRGDRSDASSTGASVRQTLLIFTRQIWIGIRRMVEAMEQAAHGGVSLIAAASCVGLILGVVTLTGIGAKLPGTLLPLAENSRLLALVLLMISTIILGMGLPSSVCYLLMATLVGPVLSELGLVPLAAHLFYLLFWYDGDGYTAGRFSSVYGSSYCGNRYHANRRCCVSICVGGIRAALRFCPKARAIAFIARWWDCRFLPHCGKYPSCYLWNYFIGCKCFGILVCTT